MPATALFLDAGHGLGPTGAADNGASGNGTTERAEVVAIAGQLAALLQPLRVEVVPVGIQDRLSVGQKIKFINDTCAKRGWNSSSALLVSIHLNAGPGSARGVESWYSSRKPADDALARTLIEHVSRHAGLPLRNPSTQPSSANRHGGLGILDQTIPAAVLVECGFLTNRDDAAVIKGHAPIVRGLYRGLLDALHLPHSSSMDTYLDVPDAWFRDAVYYCLQEGIFEMPEDRLFHPDRPATRAELAVIIARLLRRAA